MPTPTERANTPINAPTKADDLTTVVKAGIQQRAAQRAAERVKADAGIGKEISSAVDKVIDVSLAELDPSRNLKRVVGIQDTMLLQTIVLGPDFLTGTTGTHGPLEDLLGQTHTLTSSATMDSDGRNAKVVLCFVHDPKGLTRRGIEVRVVDPVSKELLDRTLTDDGGLVLLRVPTTDPSNPVDTTIQVIGTTLTLPITIPGALQHVVADLEVAKLPDLLKDELGKLLPPPLGDDPLERLPADFTPELAEAIVRLRGATRDPILGNSAAAASGADFRGRRTPVIKQMTVPRTGPDGAQYLVTLRQEWVFLGYTLGELKQVTSLDPGQVLRTVSSTLDKSVSTAKRAVDETRAQALALTQSTLSQLSTVDTLVHVATRNSLNTSVGTGAGLGFSDNTGAVVGAVIGGVLAGPVGAIVGGLFGGGAGVQTSTTTGTTVLSDTTTSTSVNTSLLVNSALQTAQSSVNTAISTASQLVRDLQSQVSETVDEISPLLSRVTNLVRWTMYENYAVISRVEDVIAIRPVPLNLVGDNPLLPVFSDEDIVEYRRWLQPTLLEPRLVPHFDTLAGAVAARIAGGVPITLLHLEIDYGTTLVGGNLTIDLGETRRTVALSTDSTSVRVALAIPPTMPADLDSLELTLLSIVPDIWMPILGNISDAIFGSGAVQISKIRVWFNGSPAARPDYVAVPGNGLPTDGLVATTHTRMATTTVALPNTQRATDTSQDALFRHINRNKSYYLSVLFQAARAVPSLRIDSAQLRGLDHRIWDLPIYGFDGDKVLVLQSVETGDENGYPSDLAKDKGAATIVQLAAPGAYSEALQGLLQLEDAAGLLHPILDPPKPVLPPVALVDLDKKSLVPIQQDGVFASVASAGNGLHLP